MAKSIRDLSFVQEFVNRKEDVEQSEQMEEQPKLFLAYKKIDAGYALFTIYTEVSAIYPCIQFKYMDGVLAARVKQLPAAHPSITVKEHVVEAALEVDAIRLEKEYAKLQKMIGVLKAAEERMDALRTKMEQRIGAQESKVVDMLVTNGLNLKPGTPKDSQLWLSEFNFRLHHQQAIQKEYNKDQIVKLSKKYPMLKKALSIKKMVVLNHEALRSILPELPLKALRGVLTQTLMDSLHEIKVKRPECKHCGGQLERTGKGKDRATGACKRCAL